MKYSKVMNSGLKMAAAVAVLMSLCIHASAATCIVDNGIVYRLLNDSEAQVYWTKVGGKPTVCENGIPPESYTGDIFIPSTITYNGKTYKVTDLYTAFRCTDITSITISAGISVGMNAMERCTKLISVILPPDLKCLESGALDRCTALKTITIPGSVTYVGDAFYGCTALESIIFDDGPEPINMASLKGFRFMPAVKSVVINRQFEASSDNRSPFCELTNLESVTVGGSFLSIPDYFFYGNPNLKSVTFTNQPANIGSFAFGNTGLEEMTLPESITIVSPSLFNGSAKLHKVTLGNAVTEIGNDAFGMTALQEINFPPTLTTIGNNAFFEAELSGKLEFPASLEYIGSEAFSSNPGLTEVAIPAGVTHIGPGAFMGFSSISRFSVDPGNKAYASASDGSYISSKDGKTLVEYACAHPATSLKGDFTSVEPYALYAAENLAAVDFPRCTYWGTYSLARSGITRLTIGKTGGTNVAAACPKLTELTITDPEVPVAIVNYCLNLTKVNLPENVTVIGRDAFRGCTKLESLDLGNSLAMLEYRSLAGTALKHLTVRAYNPPPVEESVFAGTEGLTVTVPASRVEAYKHAEGWKDLNIVGDADLKSGEPCNMPDGLYFAGDDGSLHCVYADGQTDEYDLGLQHTFQLVRFGGRIYGACAGEKFGYFPDWETGGDGQLFYVTTSGGNLVKRTLFDNKGNHEVFDPRGLCVYGSDLYVYNRSRSIRKITYDRVTVTQDYPSWMDYAWMPNYNMGISYGTVMAGLVITPDMVTADRTSPRYWLGIKMGGRGLISFTEKNIGTSDRNQGVKDGLMTYLDGQEQFAHSTFNIDTKYSYVYMYVEHPGAYNKYEYPCGLYRFKLEDVLNRSEYVHEREFANLNPEMIDGSPVKFERMGSGEPAGITQLAIDEKGDYMYWCYRAPTAEEFASSTLNWAEEYDPENPLHRSGIKRIKLGVEKPVVEVVYPGVTGYGIVPVNYEGSKKPGGITDAVSTGNAHIIALRDGGIIALEDACVTVYALDGCVIVFEELSAGGSLPMSELEAGLYIVTAKSDKGSQVMKFIK